MIVVNGLSGNNYLINNKILVDLSVTDQVANYFIINATNTSTSEMQSLKLYADPNGALTVDLSKLVKSMFKDPEANNFYGNSISIQNNRCVFNFQFIGSWTIDGVPYEGTQSINGKVFLRGGYNVNSSNITITLSSVLRSTEYLPYWVGYPTAEYTLQTNAIVKEPNMDNVRAKEKRQIKGCNPMYLRFLNPQAGYSYWLFEGVKENKSNTNLGYINNFVRTLDLGNNQVTEYNLYSKVPKRFYRLMFDLIESPDIQIYENGTWVKAFSDNNKLEYNDFTKVFETKLKIVKITDYNPSVLW